ncbi:MAG: polysaccharide biosynthesis/export family protein, partial [Bdellovibrionales bacterium]|nr:polysaccharide biosynthesis/export family protein [Bdellovibrionales bacterium]
MKRMYWYILALYCGGALPLIGCSPSLQSDVTDRRTESIEDATSVLYQQPAPFHRPSGGMNDGLQNSPQRTDAESEFRIRPGMEFSLLAVEDENIKGRFRVNFDGDLKLPYDVTVHADGLTKEQLREEIVEAYAHFFRVPPSIE